ncbi:uncharacterized protein YALI1_A13637g [Yarrowia lipolytica]|uniref:Uncharacterized protein n=1 Tax=Yarrowia lipolytica TaxID=4952 RepID=A0A1D8N4P7_YARLL|nr:hypothetical protein YALI1_A13637g [Yarrowia lipolytica]
MSRSSICLNTSLSEHWSSNIGVLTFKFVRTFCSRLHLQASTSIVCFTAARARRNRPLQPVSESITHGRPNDRFTPIQFQV